MYIILFSLKKEGNSDTCYKMEDVSRKCNANWNKPDAKGQILYDSTYTTYLVKYKQIENIMVVAKGCGGSGMKSYYLIDTEVQFEKVKSSGDGWWW